MRAVVSFPSSEGGNAADHPSSVATNRQSGFISAARSPGTNSCWTVQVLLALLFLFSGTVLIVGPILEPVNEPPIVRFVGVLLVVGALSLILSGYIWIRPTVARRAAVGLMITPLPAAGLMVPTIIAAIVTIRQGLIAKASFPMIMGLLLAFVAYGRWRERNE